MLPFDEAVASLPEPLLHTLSAVDLDVRKRVDEIRLRVGRPILLISRGNQLWFLSKSGQTCRTPQPDCLSVTRELMDECVRCMSGYSLHSVQNSLTNGFLTLKGGHRAGFSGSVAWEGDKVTAVRRVDSVNIRIARSIKGAADEIIRFYRRCGMAGTLIVGPPSSGKTTILKDLCRQLSNGEAGEVRKVALIDERGEIAASYRGTPQNDVGWNTDVFDGYPKSIGFDIAVRCMSPDVIVCDEIGGNGDAESLLRGVNAGVTVLATIHAASFEEFIQKKNTAELLNSGAFRHFVLLGNARQAGTIREIQSYDEIYRDILAVRHCAVGGADVLRSPQETGQRAGALSYFD